MKTSALAISILVLSSAFTAKYCSAGDDSYSDLRSPDFPTLPEQLGAVAAEAKEIQAEPSKEKEQNIPPGGFSFKDAAVRYASARRPGIDGLSGVWKLVGEAAASGEAAYDPKGITGSRPGHKGLNFSKERKSFLDDRAVLSVTFMDKFFSLQDDDSGRQVFMAYTFLPNKGPHEVKFSFDSVSFLYQGCDGECQFNYECRILGEDRLLCAVKSKSRSHKQLSSDPDAYVGYARR